MNAVRLVLASLLYHRRANVAVALGVAAAGAVLTGALLVGDSMRGSLRQLALERLGRIDDAMVAPGFFRQELADELARQPGFQEHFADAVPVILLEASLSRAGQDESPRRVGRVSLVGCDGRFWRLGAGGPDRMPQGRAIVLSGPLAEELGVEAGQSVVAHLPRPELIPADSPLGRKRETVRSARLQVEAIVPAAGLGRFTLRGSQRAARNAFVPLEALAELLEQPGRANALLVAGRDLRTPPADSAQTLGRLLRPSPSDYGLRLERTARGYLNITSDRMILDPRTEAALLAALKGRRVRPALTYLANTIACGGREVPYSTVSAIDFGELPPLGPLRDTAGKPIRPLADDEIVLNQWAANELAAAPGQTIRVTYFEPESTDLLPRERTVALRLAAITPLAGAAVDPELTPRVPGLTDRLSMADWDPPFPFDARRIRPRDETYWDEHRGTPKAFVSLAAGRKLWASRFGRSTSLRVASREEAGSAEPPPEDTSKNPVDPVVLDLDPAAMGFVFEPVKQQAIDGSAGATPFDVLFLGFSFFLIASAVMLVAILFRLGVEVRGPEIGLLLALGFRPRRIARLLLAEGLVVAAAGSLLGVLLGVGYAAAMLWGLRTWWVAAIGVPFVRLHVTAASLLAGSFGGLVVAALALVGSTGRLGRVSPRGLMAGPAGQEPLGAGCHTHARRGHDDRRRTKSGERKAENAKPSGATAGLASSAPNTFGRANRGTRLFRSVRTPAFVLAALALAAGALGLAQLGGQYQVGAFFAAGALVLVALVVFVRGQLRRGAVGGAIAARRGNLLRLAARNAARHPGRSSLSIGLVAAACFLIVATSAFHLDPTDRPPRRDGSDGGFALVAESDQPLYQDLGTAEGRQALGFSQKDQALLAECEIFSLRAQPGEDASCQNLYQVRRPRVLGVPRALIARGGFAWAAPGDADNPWRVLDGRPASTDTRGAAAGSSNSAENLAKSGKREAESGQPGAVPVVLEKNTANYALHLWGGLGESYLLPRADGPGLPLRVAGLLGTSLFQGDLLISEDEFLRHFPQTSGWRFFLVEAPPEKIGAVRAALERTLGDFGLVTEPSAERLAGFLAVQNTYLATFQSLGGLGLLLGTFALAAVQLRNVLERRRELALLRAIGLRRRTIGLLVLAENALLLAGGLAAGITAALVAILPQLLGGSASMPWASLAGTLAVVLATGLLASLAAVRAALRAPLLATLREE